LAPIIFSLPYPIAAAPGIQAILDLNCAE